MRHLLPVARALASLVLLAAAGVALRPAPLSAQGTALVAITDPVYRDIDRLVELGAVDGVIVGQRPYSHREIARIAQRTRDRLDRAYGPRMQNEVDEEVEREANGILQRLETRFGMEADQVAGSPYISLIDGFATEFISTDAVRRGLPGNEASATEATIQPMTYRRLGRQPIAGSTLSLDLKHRFEPTNWLALRVRERFEYRLPNDTALSRHDEELLLASLRARVGNLAVTVGREAFAWSQGEGDGLFLASDAPALDQVSISGDEPFRLPGVARHLGVMQGTVLLADLGPSVVRSHSRLLAYKLSVQPHADVELGGTFFNHFGGEGSPSASFGDRLVDFLPFVDVFRRHNYADSTRTLDLESDKLLGVDGRWRMSRLAGITLAGELLIDDFDVHQVQRMLTGYGSSQVAITVPQLFDPAWSLRFSAKHMGITTYAHSQLTNGITSRGRLLGDELGPNAKAFGAQLRWMPASGVRISVEERTAIYSDATYQSFYTDSAQTNFMVQKTSSNPDELRDRLLAAFEFQSDEGLSFVVRGGGERIRNLRFTPGPTRNEYLFDVALRLRM